MEKKIAIKYFVNKEKAFEFIKENQKKTKIDYMALDIKTDKFQGCLVVKEQDLIKLHENS